MSADRPAMPPVLLSPEAALARDALAAPLFGRAVRLARWAVPRIRAGADGRLPGEELDGAIAHLELTGDEDGAAQASAAWRFAVGSGLVTVAKAASADQAGAGGAAQGPTGGPEPRKTVEEAAPATAATGEKAALVTSGSPRDILGIWLAGLEAVLGEAAAFGPSGPGTPAGSPGTDSEFAAGTAFRAPGEKSLFEGVLANLYLLTALGAGSPERAVPLPALAAAAIIPEEMEQPTDEVLEEVSEAVMRLDDHFRLLASAGLVDYRPVDGSLIEKFDGPEGTPGAHPESAARRTAGPDGGDRTVGEEDVARFGMVRLTPLGLFGLRARMLDAGVDAPAVGDLADKGADVLLDRLPGYPEAVAHAEAEQWLARREPTGAARELLAAARGDDPRAPMRRLACQQALLLLGPEAGLALREVLDDPQLGGLARVGLAERGAADVPPPPQEMVFWLTIDTIAAQLGNAEDTSELRELVEGVVGQHSGFFDEAWRVDHPATAEVLETMGQLHPDRKLAKAARKAAFRVRSRTVG